MKKKLSSLIVLTLFSLLIFALPTLADSKPASSNNMSDNSSSSSEQGTTPMNAAVASDNKFQVNVQFTPDTFMGLFGVHLEGPTNFVSDPPIQIMQYF